MRPGKARDGRPAPVNDGRRAPDYGFDAPAVPMALAATGILLMVLTVVLSAKVSGWWWLIPAVYAAFFLLSAASFWYTTRHGKFVVWRRLLADLHLTGQESIVDLGCGRGAVLILATSHHPTRPPVGVDLWRGVDQSGNDPAATLANASVTGARIALITGDLRQIPLEPASIDVVVSSLAIHNIPSPEGRRQAVEESARLLAPGGRLLITDFRHASSYAEELRRFGLTDVQVRRLGWRFWYGGPWGATSLVTASRPG